MSKRRKTAKDYLELPKDVMITLLSRLDPASIETMCRVNSRFNELCNEDHFWHKILNAARIPHDSNATNEQNRRMFIAHYAYTNLDRIRLIVGEGMFSANISIIMNDGMSVVYLYGYNFIVFESYTRQIVLLFGSEYIRNSDGGYEIPSSVVLQLIYTLLDEYSFKLDTENKYLSCSICDKTPEYKCNTCDQHFCSIECSLSC